MCAPRVGVSETLLTLPPVCVRAFIIQTSTWDPGRRRRRTRRKRRVKEENSAGNRSRGK